MHRYIRGATAGHAGFQPIHRGHGQGRLHSDFARPFSLFELEFIILIDKGGFDADGRRHGGVDLGRAVDPGDDATHHGPILRRRQRGKEVGQTHLS